MEEDILEIIKRVRAAGYGFCLNIGPPGEREPSWPAEWHCCVYRRDEPTHHGYGAQAFEAIARALSHVPALD